MNQHHKKIFKVDRVKISGSYYNQWYLKNRERLKSVYSRFNPLQWDFNGWVIHQYYVENSAHPCFCDYCMGVYPGGYREDLYYKKVGHRQLKGSTG